MAQEPAETLRDSLAKLNGPQLGSFGEAVFGEMAARAGMYVETLHYERADFVVDGVKTDVKTSRDWTADSVALRPWAGKRVAAAQYAMVEFYRTGLRVSLEGRILADLGYSEVQDLWVSWQAGKFGRAHLPAAASSRKLPENVRKAVEKVFETAGLPAPLILHRTCHRIDKSPSEAHGFSEGPHNLLPSQREEKKRLGWTVYLMFSQAPPNLTNLIEIVAFPDSREGDLPRLGRVSLGTKQKADMKRLPADVHFRSLEDLGKALLERRW